ncbi:FAD/FMN-containing dehydrogenase [Lentzea atacamensis]|uniref:FAD/FMN-containing dehydrogenase n=1 Tax=Lentzea atacamensis TaxID=531938 RepID=A0A316I2W5_9PSEU|nr:FAD-binding oxidoreductase [Lentzea atacamensis]PWK86964.1 FAD/FMN-containing dehydrogenase [Lentzea atacamensis]
MIDTGVNRTVVAARALDETLRAQLVIDLSSGFKGPLIHPDSAGYDVARAVWNGLIDKHPGLIARCVDTKDVVIAVNAARRLGVAVAVRGGGHSVAGKSHVDGGLTIDLSLMRRVQVDVAQHVVHAEGGCLLKDLDEATEPHGLAVPLGTVSETGLGGLALGGGAGWLTRKHGLTCDNFHSVEVVTANGEIVEASPERHPSLFWALRGGSGNFGIVTRFTLRAHRLGPPMRIGVSLYRPEDAAQALGEYAALAPTLPRIVGWHGALKRHMPPLPFVPDHLVGERLLMLFSMWLADAGDPESVKYAERLCRTGNPCLTTMTVLPFGTGMQKALDPEFADGHRYYTKQFHLGALSTEIVRLLVDFWATMPMRGEAQIIQLGGAMTDVPEDGSAFANRAVPWWLNVVLHWDDAACDDAYFDQTCEFAVKLTPHVAPGAYINSLNADEADRVVDAYGGPQKYTRLGRLKARYDPHNLFRINHNIEPVHLSTAAGSR